LLYKIVFCWWPYWSNGRMAIATFIPSMEMLNKVQLIWSLIQFYWCGKNLLSATLSMASVFHVYALSTNIATNSLTKNKLWIRSYQYTSDILYMITQQLIYRPINHRRQIFNLDRSLDILIEMDQVTLTFLHVDKIVVRKKCRCLWMFFNQI
jgi:hypothetical protein